jgi:hypothetical protein
MGFLDDWQSIDIVDCESIRVLLNLIENADQTTDAKNKAKCVLKAIFKQIVLLYVPPPMMA